VSKLTQSSRVEKGGGANGRDFVCTPNTSRGGRKTRRVKSIERKQKTWHNKNESQSSLGEGNGWESLKAGVPYRHYDAPKLEAVRRSKKPIQKKKNDRIRRGGGMIPCRNDWGWAKCVPEGAKMMEV